MTIPKLLAASLFGVMIALPAAHADFRPGDRGPMPAPAPMPQRPGDFHGPGGPGHGPDMRDPRDRCRFDPRQCFGPRPGFPPPPPPPPVQPLPPPPSFAGDCAGNFSGTFADGRQVMISVNGAGQYVTASLVEVQPQQQSLVAQGVCTSVNGVSQLSLTMQNGVIEAGQIYEASDGKFYFDGTENSTNSRFILQRQ